MSFSSPSFASLFSLGLILILPANKASAQALTDLRNWTSSDGKVIQGQVLTTESSQDGIAVRLRHSNGNVFRLGLDRFAPSDQARILHLRIKEQFRTDFSRDRESCFLYSRHLKENDWRDRTWAYIGSDEKKSWLRLAIYREPDFFSEGNALIVRGNGYLFRVKYDEDDYDEDPDPPRGEPYQGIDVLVTKQHQELFEAHRGNEKVQLFLQISESEVEPIELSSEERDGLEEVLRIFPSIATLSNDQTWWATLLGKDPAVFRAEAADPLREWRYFDGEPLIALRSWTNQLGQTLQAEVIGFQGSQVVLRNKEDKVLALPAANFDGEDLLTLATARLHQSLRQDWHSIDDSRDYYWPHRWESENRFRRKVILLAFDRSKRTPHLILQAGFDGSPLLSPRSISLESPALSQALKLSLEDPDLVRTASGVNVWHSLTPETAGELMNTTDSEEALAYILESVDTEPQEGSMSRDEFAASIEALETYRLLRQWLAATEATALPDLTP